MITVIGSVNMDLIATTPRLPEPGETVSGTDFTTAQGGKGANQALAAQRAGAAVKMCGAVGNDAFASEALALLGEAGADLELVRHVEGPTGTALILVGGDGENMIAVIPGANGEVTAEDAERAVAEMAANDTLVLQMEIPEAAIEAALKAAKAMRVRSVLNIAPLTDAVVRLAPLADIVIANETEFARLSGRPAETLEAARTEVEALHARTGQCLIVHAWRRGCAVGKGREGGARAIAEDQAGRHRGCRRHILRLPRPGARCRDGIRHGRPSGGGGWGAGLSQTRRSAVDSTLSRCRCPSLILSEAADALDKQVEEAVGVDVLDDKGILGATGDLPPVDHRGAEGKIRAGFYFHVALAT
jgi:ribokinase